MRLQFSEGLCSVTTLSIVRHEERALMLDLILMSSNKPSASGDSATACARAQARA